MDAGEYVARKQGSDRSIFPASSCKVVVSCIARRQSPRERRYPGGCFPPDQKPGSGKSILRFAIEVHWYCTAMSNAGEESSVVTCILKLRKGGMALVSIATLINIDQCFSKSSVMVVSSQQVTKYGRHLSYLPILLIFCTLPEILTAQHDVLALHWVVYMISLKVRRAQYRALQFPASLESISLIRLSS